MTSISQLSEDRKFSAFYGISPQTFTSLHSELYSFDSSFEEIHLKWTLYFLKTYPTGDVAAQIWNINRKTFETHVWDTIERISLLDSTVSNYELI